MEKSERQTSPSLFCLIPARGGSRGIAGKNIAPLCGKPLIAWTIELALRLPGAKVQVTTDSRGIAKAAREFGAGVIERPAKLAGDGTPMLPVVRHAIESMIARGEHPDFIVLLQPTSPLRSVEDVMGAVGLFKSGSYDMVTTVTELPHPLEWTFRLGKQNTLVPVADVVLGRRQDAAKLYSLNGAVYVFKKEYALSAQDLFSGRVGAYVMPRERSLDIDEPIDLKIAECLLSAKG